MPPKSTTTKEKEAVPSSRRSARLAPTSTATEEKGGKGIKVFNNYLLHVIFHILPPALRILVPQRMGELI